MTLIAVWSGGQNGVDVAALRAAHAVGLKTGGWMPPRYMTLDGPRPEYQKTFGMQALPFTSTNHPYVARTFANVRDTGATLRIARNFDSAGEKCTWNAIVRHRKPHEAVKLHEHFFRTDAYLAEVDRIVAWLQAGDWPTVNIAGNSERTSPGIGVHAYTFLHHVFATLLTSKGSP